MERNSPFGVTRRYRLEKLLENSRMTRLTLICGLPGVGKSTCVENYVQSLKSQFFYYNLLCEADSISGFLREMSSFIQAIFPEILIDSLESISVEKYAQYLTAIFKLPENARDVFVVIDNYLVDYNAIEFHDFMQILINNSPANIHYILLTTKEPTWDLLLNNIKRKMLKVRNEQLLFTRNETKELYTDIYSLDLNVSEKVYDLTEGWPIALVIIGEKLTMEPDILAAIDEDLLNGIRKLPELASFIEQKVLANLTIEKKNALYATSIVQEFNEELVVRLIGKDGPETIERLCNEELLISCVMVNPKTYRYNKLWRALLVNKARQVWGVERLRELHKRIGYYYFEHENWKAATLHFIEAEDLDLVVSVIEQCGMDILDKKMSSQFYLLLTKVPIAKLQLSPWLQLCYANYLRFKDPESCDYYLDLALEGFRNTGDNRGIMRYYFIKVETLMFYSGGLHKMMDLINDQEIYSIPKKRLEMRLVAYKQIYAGWSHCYLTGNLIEAVKLAKQARRTSVLLQDNNIFVWSCWILGIALSYAGKLEQAKGYISEGHEKLTEADIDAPLTMMIPYIAGFNGALAADFRSALTNLELAAKKAKELGLGAFDFYTMNYAMNAADYLGDFEAGEQYLEKMKESVVTYLKEDNFHARSFLAAARAQHAYLMGKYHQALNYAKQSLELREKAGGETFFVRCHLILGAVYRRLGHYSDSQVHLLAALDKSINVDSAYFKASCYVQLSLLYVETGDKECFNEFANKAMQLAMDYNFHHFFMWKDEDIVKLANLIKEWLPYRGYIEELIEHRKLIINNIKEPEKLVLVEKNEISSNSAEPIKPLKLYLMGPFSMEINGTQIRKFSSRKALYMLKMLGTRTEAISVQKLIQELWSDWETKSAMNNFYFTLHQLRKILGNNDVVSFQDGLCKLESPFYWTDVRYFDSLVTEAKVHMREKREKEALELLDKAAKLYRGEFLEGEELGEILTMEREHLERKYYEILLCKAKILTKHNKFSKAIEVIEKARQSSFFDEDAHRILMIAFYSQGNLKQAAEIYKKLKNDLHIEMEAIPNNLTTMIYDRICKGNDVSDIIIDMFREMPSA